jgi:hypothetical protein
LRPKPLSTPGSRGSRSSAAPSADSCVSDEALARIEPDRRRCARSQSPTSERTGRRRRGLRLGVRSPCDLRFDAHRVVRLPGASAWIRGSGARRRGAIVSLYRVPSHRIGLADPLSSYRAIENLIATYAELVDVGDFAGGRQPASRRHLYRRCPTNIAIKVDEAAGKAASRSYFTALQARPDLAATDRERSVPRSLRAPRRAVALPGAAGPHRPPRRRKPPPLRALPLTGSPLRRKRSDLDPPDWIVPSVALTVLRLKLKLKSVRTDFIARATSPRSTIRSCWSSMICTSCAPPKRSRHSKFLPEELPTELHVVLATRRDPQLGLHRLRLAGDVTELRASHLRFTPQPARASRWSSTRAAPNRRRHDDRFPDS